MRYKLCGWAGARPIINVLPTGPRLRAQVLAPARCAQCGRTPIQHCVVLDVDLRVPTDWAVRIIPRTCNRYMKIAAMASVNTSRPIAAFSEQISRVASFAKFSYTARSMRSDVGSAGEASRAALIATLMLAPTAVATGGGKALPICR